MLFVALIAASSVLTATPPTKTVTVKPVCHNPGLIVATSPDKPSIHPLSSEPPARWIKAVVREIDGCNIPVVISAQVGTPKR